ncbi:MAG TPA: nucleoside hydrolase, partial [Acidobacteriaceae bacterium]|nr:nucleoside hydrolase [Acidobacteriaceae bacterium]
ILSLWFILLLTAISALCAERQKIILDTDIGDDIDDAYALTLALHSPEFEILGVTTAWGDTTLRAQLAARLLAAAGAKKIPVLPGVRTHSKSDFSQRAWAAAGPAAVHGNAVDFLLAQAKRYPHQITLIAIGPLTNVGAAINRDPSAFRLLDRVVLMGGSIHCGYGNPRATPPPPPQPEYNIATDPGAARKLLASGVPIFMMPLDSTQWKLDDSKFAQIAARSTPSTDALLVLTTEWRLSTHQHTPTLYDAMAVTYALHPDICPTTPLRLQVDDKGFTRVVEGQVNAHACLKGNGDAFFELLLPRLSGR